MIGRILSALGLPPAALAWIAFGLAVTGSATVSGVLVHRYDQAQHDQVIARLEADAALTTAAEIAKVLERERAAQHRLANLENAYARLSVERSEAAAENSRLSADLAAAADRMRRAATTGRDGDGVSPGGAGADRCADLRAALDRALGAVDILRRGGDQAAELGQHAVDVATIAAREAGHE